MSAPEVRYLGENASLFLRYLNATRAFQLGADAEVRSESLDAEAAGAVVEALWRDRALIVHDKAAYREAIKGSKLAAQLKAYLEDDSFLTILAGEYMRQQQRAMEQARAARGAKPAEK